MSWKSDRGATTSTPWPVPLPARLRPRSSSGARGRSPPRRGPTGAEELRRKLAEARNARADEADFEVAGMGAETAVEEQLAPEKAPEKTAPAPAQLSSPKKPRPHPGAPGGRRTSSRRCGAACTRKPGRPRRRCAEIPTPRGASRRRTGLRPGEGARDLPLVGRGLEAARSAGFVMNPVSARTTGHVGPVEAGQVGACDEAPVSGSGRPHHRR